MSPEWITAYCATATIGIGLIASLWKFSRSIDRMSYTIESIVEVQKAHTGEIVSIKTDVSNLQVQVAKLEGAHERRSHA